MSAAQRAWEAEREATANALALGCEVCGNAAYITIARRTHTPTRDVNGGYLGCTTQVDPSAPIHPRCSVHANADAYVLDGVKPCDHCVGWK